jgi:hypothetical protein
LGLVDVAMHTGQSTAFVCLEDDAAGLRATIRMRDALPQRIPIVLCTTGHSEVAQLLSLARSNQPLNVSGFGLLDQVCRPEVLLNGDMELIAQAVHGEYVRSETSSGRSGDDVSMRPWDFLPEPLRESNRDQAADIGRKLNEVGLDLVVTSNWGPPDFAFHSDDLEDLAREEHDRWMQKLLADGWIPSPMKDVGQKLHPLLVPWESLTDEQKDKDRNAVRAIPTLLARAGYAIAPRERNRPAKHVTEQQASDSTDRDCSSS